ncbi:hypothetical protein C8Q74DRAFT_1319609 [Fomes fomentarius]|nr:hypothetical protein C8Q74DRAFT_1319609 [Fomes fomentarius]
MPPVTTYNCRYCGKPLETRQGVKSHLAQRPECLKAFHQTVADDKARQTVQTEGFADAMDCDPAEDYQPYETIEYTGLPEAKVPDEDAGHLPHEPWVEDFLQPAGTTFGRGETYFDRIHREKQLAGQDTWMPFESEDEWELAKWLMTSGLTQKDIDHYLKLKITCECTRLSFTSAYLFYKKIDSLPGGFAQWRVELFDTIGDEMDEEGKLRKETVELWYRDPIECIRELIGNPFFKDVTHYAPERVYVDAEGKVRMYDNMWTTDWWWDIQLKLPPGATVAPVILASDKTTLSRMSGDKSAWPVYLSIGNIDKGTRRKPSSHATVLLGYLPVAKLECFSEKRRSLEGYRLYHLREGIAMVCADGFIRCIYPLLAAYIADHPEQCLISACRENFCPKCPVNPRKRGEPTHACLKHPPDIISILERTATGEKVPEFDTLGLRPLIPFWKDLPHCNIFAALTPDILHQLHKGLFKDHLVKWVTKAIAGGKEEIDYRFKTMTRHSNLRQFKNGISMVTQWTGNEYKNMERVFLGVIAGAGEPDVTLAVRAVLNFIYYAHFKTHTDRTLDALYAAWLDYHHYKLVFQHAGIHTHFNFPKGHSTEHYEPSIRALGTADGYNTEHPERLHIDFAKVAYSASNKQNTYLKQMTNWLNRQEAISLFPMAQARSR